MNTLPPPARPDNSAALPPHPQRVADAYRRLHESQVELATGTACSAGVDRAEAAYRDAVADAVAEDFARQQLLIGTLRLLAGDETGLREVAALVLAEVIGTLPQNTAEVLGDVVRFCKATRRELAALGVEELDSQTRLTAVELRLASVESLLKEAASGQTACGTGVCR